jgi:hypothetical protein
MKRFQLQSCISNYKVIQLFSIYNFGFYRFSIRSEVVYKVQILLCYTYLETDLDLVTFINRF